MNKNKKPDLSELNKLNPADRQRILKELLSKETNENFLKLLSEEIRKAELEEEKLENLENLAEKKEGKKESNLDNLVEKYDEETNTKKEQQKVSGALYNVKEQSIYDIQSAYAGHQHTQEFKSPELALNSDKVTTGLSQESLSNNSGLDKTKDLYNKKKTHEHGH